MDQHRYNKCKHDISWRKHYKKSFDYLHSNELKDKQGQIHINNMLEEYQRVTVELNKIKEIEQAELKHKWKSYLEQQKDKIESAFTATLSPEDQEVFIDMKTSIADRQKEDAEVQRQLDKVLAKVEEEGIDLDSSEQESKGLGDKINSILSSFGVTEETLNKWSGLKGGCGCNKRQKFLNKIFPSNKKE